MNAVAFGPVTPNNKPEPIPDVLVPLGARVTAKDIAESVVFLASAKARYITGVTLPVDGGFRLINASYLRSRGRLKELG